jgi:enamine deaminase RidA (YjgF/YER057c/UK114 family)
MISKYVIQPDLGREYRYLAGSKVGQLTHSAGVVITDHFGHRTIHCSGKTATNDQASTPEERDRIVGVGDIYEQTRQVCRNIQGILATVGATMRDIVRVRVFVVAPLRVGDFAKIHDARAEFFDPEHYPASTLVLVAGLVRPEARIEMDAEAVVQVDPVLAGEVRGQ